MNEKVNEVIERGIDKSDIPQLKALCVDNYTVLHKVPRVY